MTTAENAALTFNAIAVLAMVTSAYACFISIRAVLKHEPPSRSLMIANPTLLLIEMTRSLTAENSIPEMRPLPDDVAMRFWVIYDHPTDFPIGFVLRAQHAMKNGKTQPDDVAWYADGPDKLRSIVPFGLKNIGRNDHDDPAILEVWV